MMTPFTRSAAAFAVPFAALAGATMITASPAAASSWGEKVAMCAEAVEDRGVLDLADYRPRFDDGSSRRVVVEFEPRDGGESIFAECRISRGEVTSVDIDA